MSPSFGDLLGDKEKGDLFDRVVKEGVIIHHFDNNVKPEAKDKFIIIASAKNDDVLVVYINTIINLNFNPSLKEQNLHIPLRQNDFPNFLKHNSFIDCCHPTEKKMSELRKEVSGDTNRFKGDVPKRLLRQIIEKLEEAHTIKPKLKKKYGLEDKSPKTDFNFF